MSLRNRLKILFGVVMTLGALLAPRANAIQTKAMESFGFQTHAEWTGTYGSTYSIGGILLDYEIITVGGNGSFSFAASTQVNSATSSFDQYASTGATALIYSSNTISLNGIPYHEDMRTLIFNPQIVVNSPLAAGTTMYIDMTYLINKQPGDF